MELPVLATNLRQEAGPCSVPPEGCTARLFPEGIDYFAMPAEVEPSEGDRRALAAANPERKMGKRKKLSARKDVQDLINEMDPASCGLPCQPAPVPLRYLS